MTTFTQAEVDALAWVYVASRNRDNDRKVEPGDFGTRRQENAEVILARNHACTPVAAWHIAPEFRGVNGGETGV